jgi:hypothetical protein
VPTRIHDMIARSDRQLSRQDRSSRAAQAALDPIDQSRWLHGVIDTKVFTKALVTHDTTVRLILDGGQSQFRSIVKGAPANAPEVALRHGNFRGHWAEAISEDGACAEGCHRNAAIVQHVKATLRAGWLMFPGTGLCLCPSCVKRGMLLKA